MSVSQQLKNKKRQIQKRKYEKSIKVQLKEIDRVLVEKNLKLEEGEKTIRETQSILDKMARKGVIHKNNARHKKSKIQKKFNELGKRENV
jgi:small subunit ribosomal protein S20